jgi:hypothetical protein
VLDIGRSGMQTKTIAGFNHFNRDLLMHGFKWLLILLVFSTMTSRLLYADELDTGAALKGVWFNPEMAGQGFFIEVFEEPPVIFMGWFGFPRPSEAVGGDPLVHRWYTLEGTYSEGGVEMQILQTSGGVFTGPGPVETIVVGSALIRFADCNHATVSYQFDAGEQGELEITRIVPVPESDCDELVHPETVPPEFEENQTAIFEDVTILQMPEATLLEDQFVVVQDGLIQYVGQDQARLPGDGIRIDGRSRYLIPGLVDTHSHLASHAPRTERDTIAANELLQYMGNGVTTILVPGNGFLTSDYNARVAQGAMDGPLIYDAQWVFSPGVGGGRMPSNPAEARAAVREAANDGYQFIKIFDFVSRDVSLALLDEAAVLGMPTIAHFQTTMSPVDLMNNGLDLVAHIQEYGHDYFHGQTDESLIPQAVEDTLRNGTSVTSTLVIDELTAQVAGNNQAGISAYWARPETRWLIPESVEATWDAISNLKAIGGQPGNYDDDLAFLRTLTRKLHEAGVPILMGTDAPGTGAVPGFSVHWEVQALLDCGIELGDVLRISSWNGARFIHQSLGLETSFGAVRQNWRADLVLLNSNPLSSQDNLKDIAGVMAAGRWRSGEVLEQRIEAIAQSYHR